MQPDSILIHSRETSKWKNFFVGLFFFQPNRERWWGSKKINKENCKEKKSVRLTWADNRTCPSRKIKKKFLSPKKETNKQKLEQEIVFFSKLYWVLVGLMIFMISYYINDIMIGYTELYWVLLNYFWVVLGYTGLLWVLVG